MRRTVIAVAAIALTVGLDASPVDASPPPKSPPGKCFSDWYYDYFDIPKPWWC